MNNHFIHYLKREVSIRWGGDANDRVYCEEQHPADGFERPRFHITRASTGPVKRINDGDVIWLFSVVSSPWGKLPPALDAKFVVERVEHLADGRVKFHADNSSSWFPLCDATELIRRLKTEDRKGGEIPVRTDDSQPLGLYLQSIRLLSNPAEIIRWNERLVQTNYDFISYRIKDGTRAAFLTAGQLIGSGKALFWDRFSLPRRLAERREAVDDDKLDSYLRQQIGGSACVWGIESPRYSEPGSYSLREATLAKSLSKYQSVIILSP